MNEQTEQEPVAWRDVAGKTTKYYDYNEQGRGEPLYTAPPKREWVGLTDEDSIALEWERVTGHTIYGGTMFLSPNEILEFAEAIEAKLRKKNMEVEE